MPDPLIVVPDDFPSVFEGSAAHQRAAKLGDLRVYSQRGADDQDELIRRLDRARIAINIRAHARFTDAVFAACPKLQLVSIWGTGTDNVDLGAAGRRGTHRVQHPRGQRPRRRRARDRPHARRRAEDPAHRPRDARGGLAARDARAVSWARRWASSARAPSARGSSRSVALSGWTSWPGARAPTPSASRASAPPRRPRTTSCALRTSSAFTCAWSRRRGASSGARSSPS